MKVRYMIFILIIIIIIAIVTIYYHLNAKYIYQFKANWNLSIPKSDKVIFKKKKDVSFNGDGEQYFVLEYNNSSKIEKLKENINWENSKNIELENEILELLDYTKIPKENIPDFNNEYLHYSYKKADFTRIYLIYINQKIYIIEQIT